MSAFTTTSSSSPDLANADQVCDHLANYHESFVRFEVGNDVFGRKKNRYWIARRYRRFQFVFSKHASNTFRSCSKSKGIATARYLEFGARVVAG